MPLTIEIHLLGEFCLKVDGCDTQLSAHSYQLWNLLGYLIVFRRREIPHYELIKMLWPENDIDNPSNALKNLIYRIRTNLSKNGHPALKGMIAYSKGKYTLSPNFDYKIDIEEFENLCQRAQQPDLTQTEQIELYYQIFDLYKGDFFPELALSQWVIPLHVYYHQMYITAMNRLLELLEKEERYEEMVTVCKRAIPLDQMEENFHQAYIRALAKIGTPAKALDYYEYVTQMFYNELGITPSDDMKSLYLKITNKLNYVELDVHKIMVDLTSQKEEDGAFYCEYSVFQRIYQLLQRTVERSGNKVYVALLTLADFNGSVPRLHQLNESMPQVQNLLKHSLRKGDIYCKYSKSQWVALLVLPDDDVSQAVVTRLDSRYRSLMISKQLKLHITMKSVLGKNNNMSKS